MGLDRVALGRIGCLALAFASMFVALFVFGAGCALAQSDSSADSTADMPATGVAQPLAETKVEIPLKAVLSAANAGAPPGAPQTTPTSAGAPQGAPPTSAQQTSTPLPAANPLSERQRRKAEKLYLQGAKRIEADDPQGAYAIFAEAAKIDPANPQYLAAREVARQHLVTRLVQEAEQARLAAHPEVSRQKLEEALALDPTNPVIAQHVDELAGDHRLRVDTVDETGVDAEGPIQLAPVDGKKSFHLKGARQEVLRQVLSAYQIVAVMDSTVTQEPLRLDADDVDYAQAAEMVKLLAGTFFVPLDPKRVLIAKDTKDNRQKYERLLVESVYLPGLTDAEMGDIASMTKTVFEAPVAAVSKDRGILTVRAPEARMKALNATLADLLDGRAQVMIEVRLYDTERARTTNLGVALPSQATMFNVDSELNSLIAGNQAAINQIISSGLAAPGDYGAILAILIATGQISSSLLTQGFATFGGGISQFGVVPGTVTGNASLNASDTRALDDIHLRVQDQEAATFRVGSRYPIVLSTYSTGSSSLSAAGINTAGISSALNGLGLNAASLSAQTTIPQIQYEDIGLTLKATPRVQHGADVSLKLELELTALGGTTADNNPILDNRKYTGTITLKDGSSALVVSSLSRQETKAVLGVPGLSDLPGLRSTTDDSKNINVSNLVVLVTPHIVRRSHTDVAGRRILFPPHE